MCATVGKECRWVAVWVFETCRSRQNHQSDHNINNTTVFQLKKYIKSSDDSLVLQTGNLASEGFYRFPMSDLTHWGRDKMDATSQTTYSSAFSWIGGLPMCVLSYIFAWHRGSSGQRPWVRLLHSLLLHSLVHCHLARLCEDLFSAAIRDRERSSRG